MLAGIFAYMFTEFISERFEVPLPTRKDFLVDEVTFFFETLWLGCFQQWSWSLWVDGQRKLVPAESEICSCSAVKFLAPSQSACRDTRACLNNCDVVERQRMFLRIPSSYWQEFAALDWNASSKHGFLQVKTQGGAGGKALQNFLRLLLLTEAFTEGLVMTIILLLTFATLFYQAHQRDISIGKTSKAWLSACLQLWPRWCS